MYVHPQLHYTHLMNSIYPNTISFLLEDQPGCHPQPIAKSIPSCPRLYMPRADLQPLMMSGTHTMRLDSPDTGQYAVLNVCIHTVTIRKISLLNGNTQFSIAMLNSYVKLPEGNPFSTSID